MKPNGSIENRLAVLTSAYVLSIAFAGLALLFLVALHVLSPEFSPAWRMVSEYANGHYAWVLSLMFSTYGLSILALAYAIRTHMTTRSGRVGVVLLAVSGAAAASASVFDINQEAMHELAGLLGIAGLPCGAMLVTRVLVRQEPWSTARTLLLGMANLTWISVVLWIASFVLMVVTFIHVLGALPTSVPKEVPPGTIALAGWTNRLLLLSAWVWVAAIAWVGIAARGSRLQANKNAVIAISR